MGDNEEAGSQVDPEGDGEDEVKDSPEGDSEEQEANAEDAVDANTQPLSVPADDGAKSEEPPSENGDADMKTEEPISDEPDDNLKTEDPISDKLDVEDDVADQKAPAVISDDAAVESDENEKTDQVEKTAEIMSVQADSTVDKNADAGGGQDKTDSEQEKVDDRMYPLKDNQVQTIILPPVEHCLCTSYQCEKDHEDNILKSAVSATSVDIFQMEPYGPFDCPNPKYNKRRDSQTSVQMTDLGEQPSLNYNKSVNYRQCQNCCHNKRYNKEGKNSKQQEPKSIKTSRCVISHIQGYAGDDEEGDSSGSGKSMECCITGFEDMDVGAHSSSSSNNELDCVSQAPIDLLTEFLQSIKAEDWENAKKRCAMVLCYEPQHKTAREFLPLIESKLKQRPEVDNSDTDSSDQESQCPLAGDPSVEDFAASGDNCCMDGDDDEYDDDDDDASSSSCCF